VFGEFFETTHETTKHIGHPLSLAQTRPQVELFLTALLAAQLGPVGSRKSPGGTGRHSSRFEMVLGLETTRPMRHKNGTSYDGTAARNIYAVAEGEFLGFALLLLSINLAPLLVAVVALRTISSSPIEK
jgi:hypothetical protein